jgi:TetR/AcrR family transcriptional regulator, cholesterol catabolism regulator
MADNKVRRMRGEDRRWLIVQGAAELFADKGYFGSTLQELAEIAGIQKGSLYHFYQSKDDLLFDVLRTALAVPQAEFDRVLASEDSFAGKLTAMVGILVRYYNEMLPWMVVFTREDLGSVENEERRAELVSLRRHFEDTWERVIRDGIEAGEFRADLDYKVVTYAIIGMVNWMFKWYKPGGRLSAEEIARTFNAMVLGGILADRAAAPVAGNGRRQGGRSRKAPAQAR